MSHVYLPLMVSVVSGFLLVRILWPQKALGIAGVVLQISLAAGLGIGISACVAFLVLLTAGTSQEGLILADVAVLVALFSAFLLTRLRNRGGELKVEAGPTTRRRFTWVLAGVFFVLLISSAMTIGVESVLRPHGGWDAWMTWNLRARHLVELPQDGWQKAFTPGMSTHPDYPPLLPLTLARCWKWTSSESPLGPILVAGLFAFGTVGVIVASLRLTGTWGRGLLAGAVLLSTPFYIRHAASQYADLPLAYFMVVAVALMVLQSHFENKGLGLLTMAGLCCGLAGFTKNEGLLFVPVALAAWIWLAVIRRKDAAKYRRLTAFAAGLVPVLVLVALFKLFVAPATDTPQPSLSILANGPATDAFSESGGSILAKLATPSRYCKIAISFAEQILDSQNWSAWPFMVPIYVLLVGVQLSEPYRRGAWIVFSILVLMVTGYFMVYVVTPEKLSWLLNTSLNRLFFQLWPMTIFALFSVSRPPEEADNP